FAPLRHVPRAWHGRSPSGSRVLVDQFPRSPNRGQCRRDQDGAAGQDEFGAGSSPARRTFEEVAGFGKDGLGTEHQALPRLEESPADLVMTLTPASSETRVPASGNSSPAMGQRRLVNDRRTYARCRVARSGTPDSSDP